MKTLERFINLFLLRELATSRRAAQMGNKKQKENKRHRLAGFSRGTAKQNQRVFPPGSVPYFEITKVEALMVIR